jgi:hypothetical protein
MERLTYFKDGYWRVNFSGVQYQADFVDRLAAYEDIAELCGGFDRLRELAEADKDGRVVVPPCKVGDTVWRIKRTFEEYPDKSKPYIEPDAFLLQDVFNIGKTVFLTHEEAEKALQKMEGKKDGV